MYHFLHETRLGSLLYFAYKMTLGRKSGYEGRALDNIPKRLQFMVMDRKWSHHDTSAVPSAKT